MNSTKTKSNLQRIWLLWQTQTQGQIGDTHLRSDHTTHTTAVSKLWPLWRQPPPSSPKLNCKGCVYQDLCIILQKQLNMEPHLGLVMSGSAAKFVPLQRKGSEIAQKCWSQFCEGLHVKQVGGIFFVVFFLHAWLPSMSPLRRLKTRAELGKRPQRALWAAQRLFPMLTSISFALCTRCSTHILVFSQVTLGAGMLTSKRKHRSGDPSK